MDKKRKNALKLRINIMFVFIFILFLCIITRLGFIQIVNGEEYREKVEEKQNKIVEHSTPRGRMLDRNGKPLVTNDPINAITYTRPIGATQTDHLKLANKLAQYIEKGWANVTKRDMKDFWILTRPDQAKNKLTEQELNTLEDKELYELQLERITDADLSEITNAELEVIAIKREMDLAAALTEHIIDRTNVTNEEVAAVNAHLHELPGIDSKIDWDRKYVQNELLRSLFGNVTSPEEGIPSEQIDYYLSRGYQRNDRVGISFLEQEYEEILQGKKKQILYRYGNDGEVTFTEIANPGRKGYDIVLTIDAQLQKKVEKIIKQELKKAKELYPVGNKYLDSAFVIMMNPQTGEILSMAGKKISKGADGKYEFTDLSIGNILFAYPVGSAVKAATVLTGYKTGAIEPGTEFIDTPIKIKNTPIKKSYKNLGRVNDLEALKLSSNVYMWKIAMRMGEYDYEYNQAAEFKNPEAFDTMRYYFKQFGLGANTQIDLPYEGTGNEGSGRKIGFLMDLAIGQYDTYTPMQLAQYISTIANDGLRMKPHLLKEVWSPAGPSSTMKRVYTMKPQVLNRIEIEDEYIQRVQKGLYKVMNEPGGTAQYYFKDAQYEVAGKTGTAEVYHTKGGFMYNLTLVGYSSLEKPTVSFAVVVPYVTDNYSINKYIGRKIMDAYYQVNEIPQSGVNDQTQGNENNETRSSQ